MDKEILKIIKTIPKNRKLYDRDIDRFITVEDVLSDKVYSEKDGIYPSKENQTWYHYQRNMFKKGDAVTNKDTKQTAIYVGSYDGQRFWFLDKGLKEFEDNIYSYAYANKRSTKALYNSVEKALSKRGCLESPDALEIRLNDFIQYNYSKSASELSLLCGVALKNGKNIILDFTGLGEHPKSFYTEFFKGLEECEDINDILPKMTLKEVREREIFIIKDIIKTDDKDG